MDWKNQLTRTPYIVLFIVLITIGVGTASALITITLAGDVLVEGDLTLQEDLVCDDCIGIENFAGPPVATTPIRGGTGGNPFSITCGPNAVVVGLTIYVTFDEEISDVNYSTGVKLRCKPLESVGVFGNVLGTSFLTTGVGNTSTIPINVFCLDGEVVRGIRGAELVLPPFPLIIAMMGLTCQSLYSDTLIPFSINPENFDDLCPVGSAVIGIQGRSGALIDQVQAICG